jgi:hypothetical protein
MFSLARGRQDVVAAIATPKGYGNRRAIPSTAEWTSVRSLTTAEARALCFILATGPSREIDRIRASGLPRRTYQSIRRRATEVGWIEDRLVPDCPRFGWPYASFAIVRPFLEELDAQRDRWVNDPTTVLLWTTPEVLFRVSFSAKPFKLKGKYRDSFLLTVDCRAPGISAYFDFERSFSRWTRQGGGWSPPDPLPGLGRKSTNLHARYSPRRELTEARKLLARLELPASSEVGSSPSNSREARELINSGALKHRVFLNLRNFPRFGGQSIRRLTLAYGRLLPAERPDGLFYVLAEVTKISPFLFISDDRDVLLGVVSSGERPLARGPVLDTLRKFLTSIEVTRLEIEALEAPVSHRYSRLFEN